MIGTETKYECSPRSICTPTYWPMPWLPRLRTSPSYCLTRPAVVCFGHTDDTAARDSASLSLATVQCMRAVSLCLPAANDLWPISDAARLFDDLERIGGLPNRFAGRTPLAGETEGW